MFKAWLESLTTVFFYKFTAESTGKQKMNFAFGKVTGRNIQAPISTHVAAFRATLNFR